MRTSRDGGPGAENPPLLGALLRIPYQAMMTDVVASGLAAAGYGDVRPRHLPLTQTLARLPLGPQGTESGAPGCAAERSFGSPPAADGAVLGGAGAGRRTRCA